MYSKIRSQARTTHNHRLFQGWDLKFRRQTDYGLMLAIRGNRNWAVRRIFGSLVRVRVR